MLLVNNKWVMYLIFMYLVLKVLNFFFILLIFVFKFIWNENKFYFLLRILWDEMEFNFVNYFKI